MNTYKLLGNSRQLEALKEKSTRFFRLRERAVALFDTSQPPEELVLQRFVGDKFDLLVRAWASQSRLDELQAEYLSGKVTQKACEKVLSKYRTSKSERFKAEESLKLKQDAEYKAAEDLVRHFGRGPLILDERTHDPSFRGETVFYIPRRDFNND